MLLSNPFSLVQANNRLERPPSDNSVSRDSGWVMGLISHSGTDRGCGRRD